jgi:hypothetical protein
MESVRHHHDHSSHRVPIVLVILAIVMLVVLGIIGRSSAPSIQAQTNPGEETVEARVIAVWDEGTIEQGGVKQRNAYGHEVVTIAKNSCSII